MDKVFIKSRVDGFRRCGVAHSAEGKEFPGDFFTEEQLETLGADPDIIVVIGIPSDEKLELDNSGGDGGDGLTLDALKAAAAKAVEDGSTTGSGKPTVEAMTEILGCDVTAAQRDEGFAAFQKETEA